MNKKERIMCVMRLGTPDQVPVSAGISEMVPVRVSGKTYLDVFHYDPVPIWKLRIDAERRFDTDAILHVIPELLPEYQDMEKVIIEESEEKVVWKEIWNTPEGSLEKLIQVTHPHGLAVLEPLVKTPADLKKAALLFFPPENYNFDEYLKAYEYLGNDGSIAPYFNTPADHISDLLGGPQNFIMAHFDDHEALRRYADAYTEFCKSLLEEFIRRKIPMDVIQLGGASLSHSVTSPEFFDAYAADFLRTMIGLESRHPDAMVVQLHTCGKSRQVLTQAAELGLRAFEPIEEAPLGDVDLAEVKKTYGDRIALKGNINSIDIMLHGTPEQVRRETRKKLEIGMPGGGFFLAVGDQSPYYTPDENIHALVETVHEFGVYK
jgi:uroporphyrinogen decarboxylase